MCMCTYVYQQIHVIYLYLHTGFTIEFSKDTFSFSESDKLGYVEVTASRKPKKDFNFTLSQGGLGFSQYPTYCLHGH